VPGDDVDAIDWGASARLSAARGSDEFVVRERFAEEAPRVVVVCDRRPEMALFPESLPWLRKPDALALAVEIVADSAVTARGFVGYLDLGEDGEPFWRPPRSSAELWRIREREEAPFRAPRDGVARALDVLAGHRRDVPAGTFVFVLSDFLAPPSAAEWTRAVEHRWDLVPVVIQDPVWEQSFPPLGAVTVPVADPATGRLRPLRLTAAEARDRKHRNEERLAELLDGFRSLGLEPILISASERDHVFAEFLAWADQRVFWRGHRG
jgi:uncharacterized protein (DUF58 family)